MKKVSVIICNLNTNKVLDECLKNLKDSYDNLDVIVCDLKSSDGSYDMAKTKYPWVVLLESDNYGLASAFNLCLEHASGDYILYMGSDAFPEKGVISGLVVYLDKHPGIGAATAQLVLRDGNIDMDAHRGFPTPFVSLTHFSGLDRLFPKSKLFARYFLSFEDLNKEHEIDTCISHFMFVRGDMHNKIGLWDSDNYFIYGEDIDYCYRIKSAGFKIMYLPQFKVVHWKGASVGIRKSTADVAPKVKYYNYKGVNIPTNEFKVMIQGFTTDAMLSFYNKHYREKYGPFVTLFVLLGIKTFRLLRTLKQRF